MARKNNKECVLCHNIYTYCPDCDEYIREPFWKNMFCSEQCVNAYNVFTKYVSGVMDKEQAKAELAKADIDFEHKLKGSFATTYAEIMKEDNNQQDKPFMNEPVVEKEIANETAKTVVTNMTSEAKAIYPKSVKNKKRY